MSETESTFPQVVRFPATQGQGLKGAEQGISRNAGPEDVDRED
jgi:hypothetical protein